MINFIKQVHYYDFAIKEMKVIFGSDEKRINHALKVLSFSQQILEGEKITDDYTNTTTILSAILHDIGIHEAEKKYNSNSGKYQELEGPGIAKPILEKIELPESLINRVCYIIGHHHTASKVDDIDFQILWESDLLVNIEEDGINNKATIKGIIRKNFKTKTGTEIAQATYLDK